MDKEIKINITIDGQCVKPQSVEFDKDNNIIIKVNNKLTKNEEMVEFIKSFLTNLTIKNNFNKGYIDYYNSDGNLIFRLYENGHLWVNFTLVWTVFYDRFNLNYNETQSFIKNMVEQHLSLKDVTPTLLGMQRNMKVEQHLSLKDVTPR